MITLEQLAKRIEEVFPGADTSDLSCDDAHHISGSIYWSGFEQFDADMESANKMYRKYGLPEQHHIKMRAKLITEQIRNYFGLDSIRLGLLLPLMPKDKLNVK